MSEFDDFFEEDEGQGGGPGPADEEAFERVRSIKQAHEHELMSIPNVTGVGVGYRRVGGRPTDQPAIIVSVRHKLAPDELDASEMIPHELDGVPVDVQESGYIWAGSE
jgi:hypothetical protein